MKLAIPTEMIKAKYEVGDLLVFKEKEYGNITKVEEEKGMLFFETDGKE